VPSHGSRRGLNSYASTELYRFRTHSVSRLLRGSHYGREPAPFQAFIDPDRAAGAGQRFPSGGGRLRRTVLKGCGGERERLAHVFGI
jgi:hypothetical protein